MIDPITGGRITFGGDVVMEKKAKKKKRRDKIHA